MIARNLRRAGFGCNLMLVNPHHDKIDRPTVYPDIAGLPRTPDLAVIVTSPKTVPSLIGELDERGTPAAVIVTAGFGELGAQGGCFNQPRSTQQGRKLWLDPEEIGEILAA